jgi:hypothetical protein
LKVRTDIRLNKLEPAAHSCIWFLGGIATSWRRFLKGRSLLNGSLQQHDFGLGTFLAAENRGLLSYDQLLRLFIGYHFARVFNEDRCI